MAVCHFNNLATVVVINKRPNQLAVTPDNILFLASQIVSDIREDISRSSNFRQKK